MTNMNGRKVIKSCASMLEAVQAKAVMEGTRDQYHVEQLGKVVETLKKLDKYF